MTIYSLSSSMASLVCLCIGGVAFFKRKTRAHYFFSAILFSTAIWTLFPLVATHVGDPGLRLLAARLLYAAAAFVPYFFLSLTQSVLDEEPGGFERRLSFISKWLIFVFLVLSFLPSFIAGIGEKGGARFVAPGPLYHLFVFFFLFICGYSFWLLIESFRKSEGIKRNQIKYFFIGFGVAYCAGGLHFSAAYFLSEVIPHDIFVAIFPFIIGYAVLKYRLMDFNIMIRRATLLTAVYILILLAVAPFHFVVYKAIRSNPEASFPLFVLGTLGLGLVISSGPFIYAYLVRRSSYFRESTMSGLTHELKSPLAAIESALDFLNEQRKLKPSGPPPADYLEMIERNSSRLRQFVDDLLQVFRVENKGALLEIKREDPGELCRQVVESFRPLAEKRGNTLTLEVQGENRSVSCDARKIEQVLSNLVSNAVKFTENGGIKIRLDGKKKDQILVSVEDNGKGIPENELPHIFDRFYQGEAGRQAKGTGIGLAIAKMWVDAHGGRLWAESPGPGHGTTMRFTIPACSTE
ncbi:MAG: hypothetical protein LHV69_04300 [Elusimicrobia bacterium]|nr:hypothetical protein [Candidatus Obscuribacterium magneticum]